jgi:hypothetical protein
MNIQVMEELHKFLLAHEKAANISCLKQKLQDCKQQIVDLQNKKTELELEIKAAKFQFNSNICFAESLENILEESEFGSEHYNLLLKLKNNLQRG